jgi:hypothetical protein
VSKVRRTFSSRYSTFTVLVDLRQADILLREKENCRRSAQLADAMRRDVRNYLSAGNGYARKKRALI